MDWSEIFGLSVSPAELIIRGTVMYLFLFLLFRVVIRRRVGSVGMVGLGLAKGSSEGEAKGSGDGELRSKLGIGVGVGIGVGSGVAVSWTKTGSERPADGRLATSVGAACCGCER